MENNNSGQQPPPLTAEPPPPQHYNNQHNPNPNPNNPQMQKQLDMFWTYQRQEIERATDFRNHQLPLARIKKIMKADEDVRMISAEAPVLFSKACELFILELTIRSWNNAEENKRRTLQRSDIAAAITGYQFFDFLIDIVPRDEVKEEVGLDQGTGVGCFYPPPAGIGGMGQGMYMNMNMPMPSSAWQSVWESAADRGSYAGGGGGGGGHGNAAGRS